MASSQSSSLLELPNELLENIGEKADWPTFKSLRLTSREIAAALARLLGRRCFSCPHYMMMDRHSLKTLEKVTAHPVFGKSIKVLTLNVAQIAEVAEEIQSQKRKRREIWEEEKLRRQLGATSPSVAARCALLGTIPSNEREFRHWERAHKRVIQSAVAESDSFMLSEVHVGIVTRILRNLMRHGNTPKIFTHASRDLAIETPRGWKRLTGLVGQRGFTNDSGQAAYAVLYEALGRSQYPILDLKMGNSKRSYVDNDFLTRLEQPLPCFQHLTSLKLALEVPWIADVEVRELLDQSTIDDLDQMHADALHQLHGWLCVATNLEVLALKSRADSRDFADLLAIPRAEGTAPPFQRLRELTLWGQDIPKSTLLDFIGKHSSTLELLDLQLVKDKAQLHPDIKQEINATMGKDFKLELVNVYG